MEKSEITANYKKILQEYCQARGLSLPTYRSASRGECHEPIFKGYCYYYNNSFETEWNFRNKSDAENAAAGAACQHLGLIKTLNNSARLVLPQQENVAVHRETTSSDNPFALVTKDSVAKFSIEIEKEKLQRRENELKRKEEESYASIEKRKQALTEGEKHLQQQAFQIQQREKLIEEKEKALNAREALLKQVNIKRNATVSEVGNFLKEYTGSLNDEQLNMSIMFACMNLFQKDLDLKDKFLLFNNIKDITTLKKARNHAERFYRLSGTWDDKLKTIYFTLGEALKDLDLDEFNDNLKKLSLEITRLNFVEQDEHLIMCKKIDEHIKAFVDSGSLHHIEAILDLCDLMIKD